MITTDAQLQERCEFWQERLRLQDWNLTVRFARNRAETDDVSGRSRVSLNFKHSNIAICPDHLADPEWCGPKDSEIILVHELLHLHTRSFDQLVEDNKLACQAVELAIECIAQALVKTSRESAMRTES